MSGNTRNYKLAICELFNPYFHGFDSRSDPTIKSQFLIFELIELDDFYNNQYKESIEFLASIYSNMIDQIVRNNTNNTNNNQLPSRLEHPVVRNYANIIKRKQNFILEIIEKDTLIGSEMVAYKKTFWLRIFQRKWKNNYYRKMRFYKNPKNIFARQITGKT